MFAVIMAGGSGTRFWPASRKDKPKQFLKIGSQDPMVVETCDRLKTLVSDDEIIIVLGREHLVEAQRLLDARQVHMLAEPVGRNTAPCIGLSAIHASHLGCNEPVAFMPADHFIRDAAAFAEALRDAARIAESGAIVTLGIIPTRPETGYGYIRRSESHTGATKGMAYRVSAFVEKPDLQKAEQYLASGEYFWNAGIFVATPETILRQMKHHLPDLYEGLIRLKRALGTALFESEMEKVYGDLEAISFDRGIMEKTKEPVFVIPCECGWSDVGSWASLYELREMDVDKDRNLVDGETVLIDCKGNLVSGQSGRLVACLGLKNCLVVDTPEALLVADLNRSQEVGEIVKKLREAKKNKFL